MEPKKRQFNALREGRKLSLDDMIISSSSPQLAYRERRSEEKKAVHWGQRKLLLSEIQFFTLFYDFQKNNFPIIVYAGAAPGIHIKILSELFPNFTFHLYDPAAFVEGLHNGKTIFTYNQLFTDLDAKTWENRNDVYFISDIRTADYKVMSESEVEDSISGDMQLQLGWYNIIKPVNSLLKFRLPWPDRWPSPTYEYLSGYLFKQVWAPQSSTEGRLVSNNNLLNWNIKEYEEAMFYFNDIMREQFTYLDPLTDRPTMGLDPPELKSDYDSTAEVIILRDYLLKYLPGSNVNTKQNIVNLSRKITESLNDNLPKNRWKTLNGIRKSAKKKNNF
jgi:cap2 methyltransferase